MPVFTKESHNHFDVDHFEVAQTHARESEVIAVNGDSEAKRVVNLVTINQHIAEAIRKGRRSAL